MTKARPRNNIPAGQTLGVLAILAIVLASLSAADMFLAKVERDDLRRDAVNFYRDGTRLLDQGRNAAAVDLLRKAYISERGNHQYHLQLVWALMADRQLDEAEKSLDDLLRQDQNNGQANLLKARLMLLRDPSSPAETYYHRAIYGAWPENAAQHAMEARLELADLLASRGNQKGLLAELLPLESDASSDPRIRKRIARMFVVAGSPARAVSAYAELLRDDPNDSEASAGMGEAELARGRYYAAQTAFQNALRKNPDDAKALQDLHLVNTLTALDPSPRRLSSIEKYRRSVSILELARDSLERCATSGRPANADEIERTIEEVDKALPKKIPATAANELSEEKLALADRVWKFRMKSCGTAGETGDDVLRLILEKLDQL